MNNAEQQQNNSQPTHHSNLELLKATMDSSMDMIQVFKAVRNEQNEIVDFVWILNNQASEKWSGDVIGKSLIQTNPGVIAEGIFDTFKQVFETGVPDRSERHYVHEQFDGWFLQSTVKLGDGVSTTTTDITDRKNIENLVQSVLENTPCRIMLLKPVLDKKSVIVDFEYVFINAAALSSVHKKTLVGKLFLMEFPEAKSINLFHNYVKVFETGTPWHGETYISHLDVWSEVFAKKVNENVLVTYVDITERKKTGQGIIQLKEQIAQNATDKYYSFFNSIVEGFSIFELIYNPAKEPVDILFTEVNPAFERQTDLEKVVGKTGKDVGFIVSKERLEAYHRVIETGKPSYSENYHKENDRWYYEQGSRIGEPGAYAIAAVFNDITERKQTEQHQRFILKLNDAIRKLIDPKEMLETAMKLVVEHFKATRALYFEMIDDDQFNVSAGYQTDNFKFPERMRLSDFSPDLATAYIAGKTLVFNDIETDLRLAPYREAYRKLKVQAWVGVPLVKEGRLLLILGLHSSTARKWTPSEISLLREIAERTWADVERAKAEQALQQSEQELRKRGLELSRVQEVAKVAGFDIQFNDISKSRSWRSPEYRSLHGLAPSVEYETHAEWLKRVHPYDRVEADTFLKDSINNGADSYSSEYRIVRPIDGEVRWIMTRADIERDENGKAFRIVGAHIDITERRNADLMLLENEQRFRSLVESYAQSVWEADANGERAYDDWLEAVHPDDRLSVEKKWNDAVDNKRNVDIEFRSKTNSNEYKWTHLRATPIVDENGVVLKWSGMNIDINQRKENEQLLKELNVRLQEMDKAKTNFFNNVSHEFRTPLTLLLGPLEEVLQSKISIPEPLAPKLQMAHRNAIRLQKLVNNLLDFARIEAGKIEAFYQPTDFSKITIDLASNFRSAIEKAGLKYVVKTESINEPVYLNREMWEKIVSNLLSNAFKFTQKGKIEVVIRNKKKNVELRVADTGIGIAQKNISRIFERFTRVESLQARTYEGTGIGLALVRELVEANGGNIKVKSVEGAGSEFIVSIPKGKDHLPKQQIYEIRDKLPGNVVGNAYVEEVSGWQPEDEKLQKRKMKKFQREGVIRVLVAEDNADMREYLTNILSEDKYEILAVEDGQKVLNFLRQGGSADLIVADIMMPNVDGYDLIQWLKADEKFAHIPIILLSAKANEEAKIEGLKAGADDYLVKPFSPKELRAIISSRIKRSKKKN